MIACGAYLYWRRRGSNRSQTSLPLNFPSRTPTGIRLSEDGPPATTFTHDNASTDSLPTHALQEIPELHQPTPIAYSDTNHPIPSKAASILGIGKNRRSAKGKHKGPIEEEDDDDVESELEELAERGKFGIGDEGEIGSDSDDHERLGPLGKK
ncbi:hypothetical protein I204_02985 [Kwoniella mangroviensis CBS 8886]|uniref:uncharacterized protein n=1 Tax=Kwoniella mangroviensis CBS 8507 TaxID=1296122 RepID=UPI00080CFAF0|nr:uncharacterized protein I203_00045 [Kwoniella mangroviensis CBS 8507]OCF69918.1 hypothetical protein I203_00045 [Kwoniella mangroviensis CBS 8507]OCF75693.1 hypothetical protein I204_02985 [Kwoniella mangroviensis CBS 8886]